MISLSQVKCARRLVGPLTDIGGSQYAPWIDASMVYLSGVNRELRLGAQLSKDGERVVVYPRNGTISGVYIQEWPTHLSRKVQEIQSAKGIEGVVIEATPHFTFSGEKKKDHVQIEIRYNPLN